MKREQKVQHISHRKRHYATTTTIISISLDLYIRVGESLPDPPINCTNTVNIAQTLNLELQLAKQIWQSFFYSIGKKSKQTLAVSNKIYCHDEPCPLDTARASANE